MASTTLGMSEFEDVTAVLADDKASTSFFQKGREFESRYDNHKYTAKERELLATYDSFDYLPPHSSAFKVMACFLDIRFSWRCQRWVYMYIVCSVKPENVEWGLKAWRWEYV